MKLLKSIPLIGFLLIQPIVFSQDSCETVLITGKVIDTLRPRSFYNLMVINKSEGRGVFGLPSGSFSVYAGLGDSIVLSVKDYPRISFVVTSNDDCQHLDTFYLEPAIQLIEEVVVRPLKTLEQIKEEREALALRETRMVTGIEAMQSPITALYQAFSKKEKAKRWVAEQEFADDQEEILRELLRLYDAYEIIELNDEELEEFVKFLSPDPQFLKTASEMELITFVKDKFVHYKRMKLMEE